MGVSRRNRRGHQNMCVFKLTGTQILLALFKVIPTGQLSDVMEFCLCNDWVFFFPGFCPEKVGSSYQ